MNNDADRRLLLAIVLSLGVYLVWYGFISPPPPPSDPVVQVAQTAGSQAEAPAEVSVAPVVPLDEQIPAHSEAIETSLWSAALSSGDGGLHQIKIDGALAPLEVTAIWTYAIGKVTGNAEGSWEPYKGGDQPEILVSEEGGLVVAGYGARKLTQARVTKSDGQVVATGRSGDLTIVRRFKPTDDPHLVDVEVSLTNSGSGAIGDLWLGSIDRFEGGGGRFANAHSPFGHADGTVQHLYEPESVEGEDNEVYDGTVEWFGVGDRYFMAVVIPDQPGSRLVFDEAEGGRTGVFMPLEGQLAAGETRTVHAQVWIGSKEIDDLSPYGRELDEAVEFGWFGFFSRILLVALKMFHAAIGNWGLSIIALTVLVKLLFFPLTQKAFVSGQLMKNLQPELTALKEKYADNRELQTQETMRLFREHGVNPMGGCLPSLIQLPVWIALYNVLLYAVELYGSGFLYLKDLTLMDPYGLLPSVVAVLMVLQQQLTPMTGMDPAQAKMMQLMPLIFAFIMFTFPAGLALYITVNSSLSIAQMWWIRRSFGDQKAQAGATT